MDMLHRPAHLLCILSGFYRSMPLCQWDFFIPSHPEADRGRHIMAHLHSGYTYPHVLYVSQYSVFIKYLSQFQLVCSVFPKNTFQNFFLPTLRFRIHFHEFFLLCYGKGIAVRLVAVHDENPSAFPRLCVYRIPIGKD